MAAKTNMFLRWCLCGLLPLMAMSADAQELVDPTRPAFYAGGEAYLNSLKSRYDLQSILTSKQRRVAVINRQQVSVGEQVDDAQVIGIESGQVRLRVEGVDISIPLASKQLIKKKSSL